MDGERLDFVRGARIVAADEEIGRLTHVVADPDTRDVLDLVVDRGGREWLVPLAAVRTASRDLVELQRAWSTLPTRAFDPAAFDRLPHFAVHRRGDAARMELRSEQILPDAVRQQVGQVEVGKEVVSDRRVVEVPILREEIVVERRAVEPRPADEPIGEPRVLTIPLRAERVAVERVPVVREEVVIARRTVEDTQAVVETRGAAAAEPAKE
ncbi:MAG TPA: YsnF/AvaK domain-containing protein [Chloroflexota bacterium]